MADRPQTLGLDDRPTVAQVIAIAKQIVWEERWHRRMIRALGRLLHTDWAAWRFQKRLQVASLRGESSSAVTAIVQREVDRVTALVATINAPLPREQHVRGKVRLPRGLFLVNKAQLTVPDSIDLVWPRSPRSS